MKKKQYVAPSVDVSTVTLRAAVLNPSIGDGNADNSEVFGKGRDSDEDAYSGLW